MLLNILINISTVLIKSIDNLTVNVYILDSNYFLKFIFGGRNLWQVTTLLQLVAG